MCDTYGLIWSQKQYRFDGNGLYCFVRVDWWTSDSCKCTAEYLRRSLVIVHTERSQWQISFILERSVCLKEASVTEQILRKFSNSQKSWENWECTDSMCQALFFSTHAQEPGNDANCKDEGNTLKPYLPEKKTVVVSKTLVLERAWVPS